MKIHRLTLLRNTRRPLNEGLNQAFRAAARPIEGGAVVSVICKPLPPPKIVAECFAALLLRAWQINVPEPCLVTDEHELFFGSLEVAYPNLKQRLGLTQDLPAPAVAAIVAMAAALVSSWESTPIVIAADEAIANRDRHIGQILWDGGQPAWIDHEHAFGLSDLPDENKLAGLLAYCGLHETARAGAVARAFTLQDNGLLAQVETVCNAEAYGFADFVADRLPALASKVLSRFPAPNDLLTGLSP